MIRKHFTKVFSEDLSYATLADVGIHFGYITRKEMNQFKEFLLSVGFISKVRHCMAYQVKVGFCFETPKEKRFDNCLSISHLFRTDVYIDYNWQETEFLEIE